MKKRKYLFLCLILVLLSITAVSASDTDNITVQASTDMSNGDIVSDVSEISVQEDNDMLNDVVVADEEDSQDILAVSDDENTVLGLLFDDLQKLIDDAPEGSEISLNDDYDMRNDGTYIKISKSITINGNGKTLNAHKHGWIIFIEAENKEIVLKNITFENGASSDGGAIANTQSSTSLKIINCTFKDNTAEYYGGAVYSVGELNISNSKFTSNTVTGAGEPLGGGAIGSFGSNCYIDLCTFQENFAPGRGGAIYAKNNLMITDSAFERNSLKYVNRQDKLTADLRGGAIYCIGKCSISNSDFDGNFFYKVDTSGLKYKTSGGAVYSEGDITISNSQFKNHHMNSYSGDNGHGTVYAEKGITLNNCSFYNNKADSEGGAVYAKKDITINNCIFEKNQGTKGGAVYTSTISQTVSKSVFLNNRASNGDGGAIYISDECTPEFVSCRFEGNTADNRGGAIYVDDGDSQLRVSYCTFIDNHADKNNYNRLYNCYAGHSIFNSGHYNLWDMCWLGTNNPDFNEQFTKYYTGKSDTHYFPDNRYLRIGIKINDTYYYVGNNYEVTVYFYDGNGRVLDKDLLHSTGHFSGDANFTDLKVDCNDMAAYANITKEDCVIVGELDHQTVTLKLTARNKPQTNIEILDLRIENGNEISVWCIDHFTTSIDSPYYIIMNSDGNIVRQGNMSSLGILNPEYYFRVGDLPFGSYTLTVIAPETWQQLSSNDTKSFEIIRNVSANITADNVVYGNTTTITLKADYDSLYNVSINDLVIEMNVTNGICTKQIKLNAGEYKTRTNCTNDYVELSCNEASFNVSKATPLFNLNVSSNEFTYGDEILVSHILPSDATGNISYSLNNENYANLSVNDSLKLSLDAGSYLIDATYSGDTNYYPATDSITIKINPAKNKVTVSADNVTYGEGTIIKVSADVDGIYAVDVNGTIYNVTVNNGTGNKKITLNAGTYYANATFNNKNYNTTYKNAAFSVYKADVELNITVLDEVYPQDVEGVVHASRDGEYNLTIGDYKDVIVVKDGICYFNIGTLDAGSYEAIVSLNDNNYNPVSNRTKFVVNASGTLFEIEVNVSEITYGESITVTHTINDGATGNITYLLSDGTLLDVLPVGKNLTLPVLPVGHYVITADYSGDRDFIPASDIAFFTINKAPNNAVVSVDDVTYGENTTIKVSADVDGIYAVDINGTTYNITVNNGKGNKTIALNAGTYYANATFNNNNYITKIKNTTFKVNKAPNNVIVNIDNVTYGENTTIKISADLDAVYTVDVNGTIYNITVNNGTGNKTITLNAGTYYANATFNNDNYNSIFENAVFSVDKADTMLSVYVPTTVYLQDVVGVVYSSVDGEYNVTIGDYSTTVLVENVFSEFNAGILNAGEYILTATYPGDMNHKANSTTISVYIERFTPNVTLNVSDIDWGETEVITITSDIYGSVNITVNNMTLTLDLDGTTKYLLATTLNAASDSEYKATLQLDNLNSGTYPVTVIYIGDDNIESIFLSSEFKVNKIENNAAVNVADVTYGENTTIKVSADIDGIYQVDINGTTYNITVNNGKGNKTINLNAGIYYANVTFDNKNYNTTSRNAVFSVDKADTMLSVYAPTTVYLQDVVGVVYSSVDGEYSVTIGDYSTTVLVENAFGEFNAGILNAGEYILTATYPGDLNHKANSTTISAYIERFTPNVTLNVSDIDWGEAAVITITSDIYGSVNITVNNMTLTLDLDGTTKYLLATTLNAASDSEYKATLQLDNLNSGTYPVTAVYIGDDNIESIFLSGEFKVNALNATINTDASDINVGDDETITVTLPDDATGTVTATVDGKNYTSTVENGTASITIPGLTAGEKTADIYYSGDGKYNPAEDTATFTVNKIKANMTIDANADSDGTATIIVTLPDDATGTVTVTVDGKNYTAAVENGKATFNIKGLAPGKHEITTTYSGDDKYDPIQGKSDVVVKDKGTKHENKIADNATPNKKVIKTTDKEMLKATGNPILVLLLTLMTIGIATIRRF